LPVVKGLGLTPSLQNYLTLLFPKECSPSPLPLFISNFPLKARERGKISFYVDDTDVPAARSTAAVAAPASTNPIISSEKGSKTTTIYKNI
jgi:hypothetical protein